MDLLCKTVARGAKTANVDIMYRILFCCALWLFFGDILVKGHDDNKEKLCFVLTISF